MTIEKKMEELSKLVHDFKKSNDQEIKELKEKGNADPLLKDQTEKMNEKIFALEADIKKMQTAANRTANGAQTEMDEKAAQYKAAFNKFARKGIETEIKALSSDVDADGGFLVTPEMSSEIVKKVFESSPVRQLASVQVISTDSLEIIEDLGQAGSGWVGENESRTSTSSPTLNKVVIPVHELYANVPASQKILDDAFINIEAWLSGKISELFGRDEATAFVSGNGVNKPKGMLSYTAGTSFQQVEQVVSGSSGAFTADGLLDLVYALKEPYKANASFLMPRAAIKAVRKLKDSQNQYLWAPGLQGNQPSQLLGFPVYEAADLEAIAGNSLSAIFGDIRAGYQIVDRFGIRMLRDPYTSKPQVLFYATKRVGGGVKNFEAIKIQKLGT